MRGSSYRRSPGDGRPVVGLGPGPRQEGPGGVSTLQDSRPILLTCAKGIAPYLREEVHSLGLRVMAVGEAYVETEGTFFDTMVLNLHLRTAQRVLLLLKEFKASEPQGLYREVARIEWEGLIREDDYLSVTSWVDNPTVVDSRFANQRCKDAIVDRIMERCGRRPDSGPERKGVVVHLFWQGQRCALYLDTSGEPLSRRGYRMIPLRAPLQETLAAALILATGWDGTGDLINPMCGSGTLAIEGALIALRRPPGLLRDHYGFMHLKGFSQTEWRQLRERAKGKTTDTLGGEIIATDISGQAVRAARKNAAKAGVDGVIEFAVCDYSETRIPGRGGVVILNPEYGERLGKDKDLGALYRGIGDFFKKRCHGYKGYLFTGNLPLVKKVGLRTKRRITFFNGDIECRLLEYELYQGSKRRSRAGRGDAEISGFDTEA